MSLPASWVDHLFAKLSVRYGAAFLRQWPDADAAIVKADWAEVLAGFDGKAIGYALRYLPLTPPNALQFRDICRRAPDDTPALPAPAMDPQPERVRALLRKVFESDDGGKTPAERVVAGLRARMQAGELLNAAQRAMLSACEARGDVSGPVGGAMTPIPPECLPPAMRAAA